MIKLEHVNKYFFKNKKNEIHAVSDTSLEIKENGIVALLGPSGSGKTTLLSVMAGLDKPDSGNIYIGGQRISKRRSGAVDRIRAISIGYVFQNYNLVDNMTVFDNVALVLKMTGVKNRKEIEEKVNYVLDKVGIFRYRNRYADMLSGGEKQRVGIARAIVSNPDIIIADEPTGNLDSRNTLEIMNIIRAISAEKPVVLVTHDKKIADFYASRIVRISDGRIVEDYRNTHVNELDYRLDNRFYLKDIKDHKRLRASGYNIDFYNDSGDELNLRIVIKRGNIYIESANREDHIEIVDKNSSIEFVDEHYKAITREEGEDDAIDLSRLETKKKKKYKPVVGLLSMFARGFRAVSGYSTLKKVLLIGFAISAMFITYAMSMIFGVMNVTDDEFAGTDKSYLRIVSSNISISTYKDYESNDDYYYVMPGDSRISLSMPFDDYIQTSDFEARLDGSLSSFDKLDEGDIIYGQIATGEDELVVDRMVLQSVIDNQSTVEAGAGNISDFLGRYVVIDNMGEFKITGICDLKSPCIYADPSEFIDIIANVPSSSTEEDTDADTAGGGYEYINYELMEDNIRLVKGSWPEDNYEVAVNEKNRGDKAYKIGKKINIKINGKKLKVTGYYSDDYDSDYLLVNETMVKYNLVKTMNDVTICPKSKEGALSQLQFEGANVKDAYEESREQYIDQKWASMRSMLIMAGIILLISFIEIYLIIRASFMSRIKEVGIYRAIGVKKGDIYRMFAGEIIAISTYASLPGFALMAYILSRASKVASLSDMFLVDPMMLGVCIVIIYAFNLVFGLLPVYRTIRKRPAAILARTDI